ncbi:MAG: polysaccharide deacetylase family protein [Candidatus Korarchaeota archaeon]|nr:polysaccharide deacetylase family protein [Candidatus Korarchaeota archaeon]
MSISISVDLELMWGFIGMGGGRFFLEDPSMGRDNVLWLLDELDRYEVPITFFTVGHLFLHPDEALNIIHPDLPQFRRKILSWDFYSQILGKKLYHAPDIIEEIKSRKMHEVGLHGFFHIPFNELTEEEARAEMELSMMASKMRNISPEGMAFPKNREGKLKILREYGISFVRGGSYSGRSRLSLARRLIRSSVSVEEGLTVIHSSYFLDTRGSFFTIPLLKMKIMRKRHVHFWFHPWNLYSGRGGLLDFLAYIRRLRNEKGLEILTLGEFSSKLIS